MYRHRQSGAPLLWLLLPATAVPLALLATLGEDEAPARWLLVSVLLVTGLSGWFFSSLTIHVDDGRLGWHFGPGILRRTVPLDEIERVEATRTSLLSGWGIHWTPRGWLYNVSGRDAVWVRLRSGKQFLLGTDEPARLVSSIERARSAPPA